MAFWLAALLAPSFCFSSSGLKPPPPDPMDLCDSRLGPWDTALGWEGGGLFSGGEEGGGGEVSGIYFESSLNTCLVPASSKTLTYTNWRWRGWGWGWSHPWSSWGEHSL